MSSVWADVDAYFEGALIEGDAVLEKVLRESREQGLPAINVGPLQGKLLHLLVRLKGARRMLEVGTLAGYSAIWMARGMAAGGKLITMEFDARHVAIARNNLAMAGLEEVVEVREGAALETLRKIEAAGEGPFDFVFVDGDKPNNPAYLEWALKLTVPGSVIVVDNVVRSGAVVDDGTTDPNVQGVRAMVEKLSHEKRVTATAVQTVGGKGYDGFVMMVVN